MHWKILMSTWVLLSPAAAEDRWHYLDNGQLRLGVNLSAGACIGWLSDSKKTENVLNAFDVGRYVQQSYYGDKDGSDWNGKPWRFNPVQGGSWRNTPAVVEDAHFDATSLYTKTTPRHWATGALVPECIMEQWLRLDGPLARLKFRMNYIGKKVHKPTHQELPALFVAPKYDTLAFVGAMDQLTRKHPAFPNEYERVREPWCAWVDHEDRGVGLFMPHTPQITCYRVRNGNRGDCSYVAPIQTFALRPGLVMEFECVLALGSLDELRARFARLKQAP